MKDTPIVDHYAAEPEGTPHNGAARAAALIVLFALGGGGLMILFGYWAAQYFGG